MSAGYEEFARKLTTALKEAIEADLSDAEERQVTAFLTGFCGL